jgi:hypothetical protein
MCNPKHLFSLVDEYMNLNETLVQMKIIWSIKQFPQNVSVTVFTSELDGMFAAIDLPQKSNMLNVNTNKIYYFYKLN